jgi:hypothetical protein
MARARLAAMRIVTHVLLLAACASASAAAQEASRSSGFIDFRYASHTSLSLYGGYDVGGPLLLVGMVQNPRSEYREIIGGVARPVGGGSAAATIALTGAYASDGWYGQLYLLPAIALGPVTVSGLVQFYEPLEREGARQFYLNPISGLIAVAGRMRIGASYTLATQAGTESRQTAGPTLQLSTAGWTASLSVLAGIADAATEVRMGINARL